MDQSPGPLAPEVGEPGQEAVAVLAQFQRIEDHEPDGGGKNQGGDHPGSFQGHGAATPQRGDPPVHEEETEEKGGRGGVVDVVVVGAAECDPEEDRAEDEKGEGKVVPPFGASQDQAGEQGAEGCPVYEGDPEVEQHTAVKRPSHKVGQGREGDGRGRKGR